LLHSFNNDHLGNRPRQFSFPSGSRQQGSASGSNSLGNSCTMRSIGRSSMRTLFQGSNAAKHHQSQRVCTSGSGRQADEESKSSLESDPGAESLRWASNSFRNTLATMGRHRLGNESDEHSGAKGRASRRPGHSQLPDLPRAATDPRRSVRDIRRQERVCGRCAPVSSGRQHGDGLEELEPTDRNDATAPPRRRFGLAKIVPFCKAPRGRASRQTELQR
jgi:hypothetical protein